jgi:hypothetical protein
MGKEVPVAVFSSYSYPSELIDKDCLKVVGNIARKRPVVLAKIRKYSYLKSLKFLPVLYIALQI